MSFYTDKEGDVQFRQFTVQETAIEVVYTNYRGETRKRTIFPDRVYYGTTEWHPEPQWLLRALDLEKNEMRDFALKDICFRVEVERASERETETDPGGS